MGNNKDIEKAEQYILGKMEGESLRQFRQEMQENEVLENLVRDLKKVYAAAQAAATKEKIKDLREKIAANRRKQSSFTYVYRAVGFLSAACLIAVLYLGLTDFSKPDISRIPERTTSNSPIETHLYTQGHQALLNGEYAKAAELFRKVSEDDAIRSYYRDASLWFQTIATLELNKEKAKNLYQEIQSKKDFTYPISLEERLRIQIKLLF